MYRPRPPKKNFWSFIIPFIIIISIFSIIIYWFQSLILKKEYFKNTFATLSPSEKWTQVMLSWSEKWNYVSKKIKLFKWDVIKASDFASVSLLANSMINLDKWSVVLINKLQSNNSSSQVKITIPKWRVWFKVNRMINPKSLFEVKTDNLLISTRDSIFSVNWNSIRVLDWSVMIDFYDGKKKLWHMDIWVWQELIMSDSDLSSLKIWTLPTVRAINDEFKLSSWYSKNIWNNSEKILDNLKNVEKISWTWWEISEKDISEKNSEVKKSEIKNTKVKKSEIKKVEHKWNITFDNEKKDFEIEKSKIIHLIWKVPTWTKTVKVNNWKLWKFNAKEWVWRYNWALKWKNLKEWENIYKVEVFDEDWIKFEEKEFKIFVKIKEEEKKSWTWESILNKNLEKNLDEKDNNKKNTETSKVSDKKSDIKVEQALQITDPKEWEFVKLPDWQALEIHWIPSSWAVSIMVWDYKLKSFVKWDKTFKFRIAEEWGNAKIWEKNTYKISSFDEKWNEIETIKYSIFIEK